MANPDYSENGVAVIGMAGRFPKAASLDQYWQNLSEGRDGLTEFTAADGAESKTGFVRRRGMLADSDHFDAAFFEITPHEAELMDPQHRIFLETAWHALENAGYDAGRYPGQIGIFGSASINSYLLQMVAANGLKSHNTLHAIISNYGDYLSTRTAYKLNLRGPAIGIQTACSSALTAVHTAILYLLGGQCDMALAGGVSVRAHERAEHHYEEGGIFARDGYCRPFDSRAQGTIDGSGAGVVLLKCLEDAIRDEDPIQAVIRGSAINNDGAIKAGFTAPGVQGQTDVVLAAWEMAEVEPEDLSYVEAHGTGTPIGDPIEVAALTQAYREYSEAVACCGLGSVKGNIGHLDAAAGMASLIKTILMMKHRTLVPTLHFQEPNPELELERSPFYVVDRCQPWESETPRRAGISAFGIGGTNVHLILEEAPPLAASSPANGPFVMLLSARSEPALAEAAAQLAEYLRNHRQVELGDVAFTLSVGRACFAHRRAVTGHDHNQLIKGLTQDSPARQDFPTEVQAWLEGGPKPVPSSGKRLALPGYPFQRQHYRHPHTKETPVERVKPAPLHIHGETNQHPRPLLETDYVQPHTKDARQIAEIWRECLGFETIGEHDDFFELGGDSLLATEILTRIEKGFGVELPMETFFNAPTIDGMVVALMQQRGQEPEPAVTHQSAEETELHGPLSFSQERVWILEKLRLGGPAYHLPHLIHLEGTLDSKALEQSLHGLIDRHEALRTSFVEEGGQARQHIHEKTNFQLDHKELSERNLETFVSETWRRPFDLGQPPLMHATLIRLGPKRHALLLTLHHLIADAWSLNILARDLTALYQAHCSGQPANLRPLPTTYRALAQRERDHLTSGRYDDQTAFWLEHLEGSTDFDPPRDPEVTGADHNGYFNFDLPESLCQQVDHFSRRLHMTHFMSYLTAFSLLLSRFSGQQDLVIGIPIAGRHHLAHEDLIGFFVNTLAFRVDLSRVESLSELLTQVQTLSLRAQQSQDVPFEQLVKRLQPTRGLDQAPIFQVMFSLQERTVQDFETSGLRVHFTEVANPYAQFALTLALHRTPTGLGGAFIYRADSFGANSIKRLRDGYQRLLAEMVADPSRHPNAYTLIGEDERQRLVAEWSRPLVVLPTHSPIAALAERAETHPEHEALRWDDTAMSYRDLVRQVHNLAARLQASNIPHDERPVALLLRPGPAPIVAMLACLERGLCYLPIAHDLPRKRMLELMNEAQVQLLVATPDLASASVSPLLVLDPSGQSPDEEALAPLAIPEQTAAYLIYTSGSTGRPKGVVVSRAALIHKIAELQDHYRLDMNDRVLHFASVAFDVAAEEIFPTLSAGATLVIHGEGKNRTLPAFQAFLQEKEVTVANLPAAYWHEWVHELPDLERGVPDSLRLVISGNEAIQTARWRAWRAATSVPFYNAYGTTEATITSTVYCPTSDTPLRQLPIGKALTTTRCYVLDRRLEPVGWGCLGRLCIGGEALARGYLALPRETATVFLPDPFSGLLGARLCDTGDLVRHQPDGTLVFHGRRDHQIKIRGYRIELGEIEAQLMGHKAIKEAVVIQGRREEDPVRLNAHIVPSEKAPTIAALRTELAKSLPTYMIPDTFQYHSQLPRTSTGKIDRNALHRLVPTLELADLEEPFGETEAHLLELWSRHLQQESIGRHENFFALGGDSILCIRLAAQAREQGLDLEPALLYRHQTVATLAQALETSSTRTAAVPEPADRYLLPLTGGYSHFLSKAPPFPHHWNRSVLVALNEPLDRVALEVALRAVIDRHEALQASFHEEDTNWIIKFTTSPQESIPIRTIDLGTVPAAQIEKACTEAYEQAQTEIDLTRAPLFRVLHLDLGPDHRQRLLVIVHRFIADGHGLSLLFEEMLTAYQQGCKGAAIVLPEPTTDLRTWLGTETNVPTQGPVAMRTSPVKQPFETAASNLQGYELEIGFEMTVESTQLLLGVASAELPISSLLLAVLQETLSDWAEGDLMLDVGAHGRDPMGLDLSRTLGSFVTERPVRLLACVPATPAAALALAKRMQTGVDKGTASISFDFIGQEATMASTLFEELEGPRGAEIHPNNPRTHALQLVARIREQRLRFDLRYREGPYRPEDFAQLAKTLETRLHALTVEGLQETRHDEEN